jgi:hypothetical protein
VARYYGLDCAPLPTLKKHPETRQVDEDFKLLLRYVTYNNADGLSLLDLLSGHHQQQHLSR